MPFRPPNSPWWPCSPAPAASPAPPDGNDMPPKLRRDPTVSTTTGPPFRVRVLPSSLAGSAGSCFPSLSALAEAVALLKVKDADPADRTWNWGWPLISDGSLPALSRWSPLVEAASARLEAVAPWGDCNTRTEPYPVRSGRLPRLVMSIGTATKLSGWKTLMMSLATPVATRVPIVAATTARMAPARRLRRPASCTRVRRRSIRVGFGGTTPGSTVRSRRRAGTGSTVAPPSARAAATTTASAAIESLRRWQVAQDAAWVRSGSGTAPGSSWICRSTDRLG